MIEVRFLKDSEHIKTGEIINLSDTAAKHAVEIEQAEYIFPPKSKDIKPKKEKLEENLSFSDYCYCRNCVNFYQGENYTQCKTKGKERIDPNNTCASFTADPIKVEAEQEKIETEKKEKAKPSKKKTSFVVSPNYGILRVDNYYDNVQRFWEWNPFFYDKSGIFWLWIIDDYRWEMVDEIDMMNIIDQQLAFGGQTVTKGLKGNYVEAFKRVGRMHIPKPMPKTWIHFKDKIFDYTTKQVINATAEYFTCNSLPFEIGNTSDTPIMDKLFKDWVGEERVKSLYEIIAYCCVCDYPIHLIFALVGSGRNGKSRFLTLISKFLGIYNMTATELDNLIENRFESAKLFKKLCCQIGETNYDKLKKTNLLKKLTGEDMIGFEFKNKTPFDEYNYAKLVISSNSLPSSGDTSEGFYRRWMIIEFPNEFQEGKDILKTIPELEYNNLAKKVCEIIPEIMEKGSILGQGTIPERKQKFVEYSNPLSIFLAKFCYKDHVVYSSFGELYNHYAAYLTKLKRRVVSKSEFNTGLGEEMLEVRRTSKTIYDDNNNSTYVNDTWVEGIKVNKGVFEEFMNVMSVVNDSTTLPSIGGDRSNTITQPSQCSQSKPVYTSDTQNDTTNNNQYTNQLKVAEEVVVSNTLKDEKLTKNQEKLEKSDELKKLFPKSNRNLIIDLLRMYPQGVKESLGKEVVANQMDSDTYYGIVDQLKKEGEIMEQPVGTLRLVE